MQQTVILRRQFTIKKKENKKKKTTAIANFPKSNIAINSYNIYYCSMHLRSSFRRHWSRMGTGHS